MRLGVAAALAVAVGGLGDSAQASALSAFHTPGWHAQCFVTGEESPPTLTCWRTGDGLLFRMGASGRVVNEVDGDFKRYFDPFTATRRLGFGRYWTFASRFTCASKPDGLTCWNRSGRGFRLGRPWGWRIF